MSSRKHHLFRQLPVDLGNLSLSEWDTFFDHLNFGAEARNKVFGFVYHGQASDSDSIPGLTDAERRKLTRVAVVRPSRRTGYDRSSDGSIRLTLQLHDGHLAETVIIPEWKDGVLRKCSASISSQIGCFFGCSFCATGRMGFQRNLTTGELLEQVREAEKGIRSEMGTGMSHLYFMGMGEPLHNYRAVSDALTIMRSDAAPGPAPSRITVSTVGLFRQIRMLAQDHPEVRLAVSIHSADQQKRYEIMPASSRLGLPGIRDAMAWHQRRTGNTPTVQYLLMNQINDHPDDARKLASFLGRLRANITLIMYNDVPQTGIGRTESEKVTSFRNVLTRSGFPVDIRWCYGEDIGAGCGQLRGEGCRKRVSVSMRHDSRADGARQA